MSTPGRGTAHLMVAQAVLLVTGFAVSILLGRGLGPAGFGVYGVVMSVLGWLERTLNAGVPGSAAAMISRDEAGAHNTEKTARAILVLWSLPLFVLFWFGAPALSRYFGIGNGTLIFRIAALNIPAMALFFAYEGVLKGRRHFAAVSAIQMIQSVAKLVGVLVLVWIGLSLSGAFVAHVLASLLPVAVAAVIFPLRGPAASAATAWQIMRAALPLTLYSVALVVLMNMSLWQLQHSGLYDGAVTGQFVASMNLTKILMVIPATTSGVLYVSLSWALSGNRQDLVAKYIVEAGRFALVTLVPACVLMWVDGEAVIRLLYGQAYAGSGAILARLGVAFAAVAVLDIYFYVLLARGLTGRAVLTATALIPVLFLLNAWWIPLAGGRGAASAAMAVLSLGAVLLALLTWRQFGYLLRAKTVLRVFIAGAIVAILSLLWPVNGPLLLVKMAALGVVYLAALFVMRELTAHDLQPFALWKADRKPGA
jgi:stage V sporulation protein B